jgi:apolipoprotein D and lipocalin family protein
MTLVAAKELAASFAIGTAAARARGEASPPITTVTHVDLQRFMGKWFVIANIPTFIEENAYNAVERYRLNKDGTIETTFYCRQGGFGGKRKGYHSRAFVRDTQSNAVWGMQFVWPFKADYRIAYLTDDYSQTVIAREKRDYVWIMARKPRMSPDDYEKILALLERQGYDTAKIQRVPQRWERKPRVQE